MFRSKSIIQDKRSEIVWICVLVPQKSAEKKVYSKDTSLTALCLQFLFVEKHVKQSVPLYLALTSPPPCRGEADGKRVWSDAVW